jgi:branched-chain amino acid transport system substrate-binding protein
MATSRTQIVLSFVLVMVLVLFVAFSECIAAPIYKLGLLQGWTGPFGQHTKSMHEAVKLAVEEINAKGGMLGRQIEILTRDDQYKPPAAARGARDLILRGKVDVIIGTGSSACCLAAQEITREYKMLQISAVANTERLTVVTLHPYYFQVVPSTYMDVSGMARAVAEKMKDVKSYVTISADYEFGHSCVEVFSDYMKKHRPDMKLIKSYWFPVGEVEFTSHISAILADKPDMCGMFYGGDAVQNFIKQAKGYDFFKKLIFLPAQAHGDDVIDMGEQFPENLLITARAPFWGIDTPQCKAFVEKYVVKTGRYPSEWSVMMYDAVYILHEAIKRAKSLDREAIARKLEGGKFTTLRGDLVIREIDHQLICPTYLGTSTFDKEKGFCIGANPIVVRGEEVMRTPEEIKQMRAKEGVVFKPWKER